MLIPRGQPRAMARIAGEGVGQSITGTVSFYPFRGGVLVAADICGLPSANGIFAFHIHTGSSCEGEGFPQTQGHYNPQNSSHPNHAGDLPPLFSNDGRAFMTVYTNRFSLPEILGRTVVIHAMPDDFTTQPAGAAGEKIACGTIEPICRKKNTPNSSGFCTPTNCEC